MKKNIALLLSAAIILSMASCSGGNGQTTAENAAETSAAENTGQAQTGGNSGEAYGWDSIDPDKVIAHVDGNDALDVTFGEFYSEYKYYLITYNIPDDSDPQYAENCISFRSNIATYLQYEKIFQLIAEEEGVGESSLTKEELDEIQQKADETRESFLANYYAEASQQLGEDASAAQIEELEKELMKADMDKAGLPDDIFVKWERSDFIHNKLIEKITGNAEVTEEQIDSMFSEYEQLAKDAYAKDPAEYESSSAYTQVYIPEGTRLADQILFLFDEETRSAISDARKAGNTEEADSLREQAYESQLREKAENLLALIEAGNDFDELQETYNEDFSNDPYPVVADSKRYVSEFTDAVFSVESEGGISTAVSDYGIHIIKYVGDKTLSDEEIAQVRLSMKDYLIYQEKMRLQEEAYNDWLSRYPYTVDYETLRIDDPGAAGAAE